MKAAQASAFGSAKDVLTVSPSVIQPDPPCQNYVQIAVHACSLSPGDYRMLSGNGDLIKKPAKWPYTPGGDVAGTVSKVHADEKRFQVGDRVMATWDVFGEGGLAEYTNVHTRFVEAMPDGMSFLEAAAMVNSSVNAMLATEDAKLSKGDSLLILGGSGGVGTALVQLARKIGASPIVVSSTDETLVKSLGADVVVNHRSGDWWAAEGVKEHAPFDVVIDCAEGVTAWEKVREEGLLKTGQKGGRFLAVVANDWHIVIKRFWHLIAFFVPVLCRMVSSCMHSKTCPSYRMLFPAPRGDSLPRFLKLLEGGDIKAVIDSRSPLDFTTDGVREAFETMVERKGHGKVLVTIRDED